MSLHSIVIGEESGWFNNDFVHAGAKPPLKEVIDASQKFSNMAAKMHARASVLNMFPLCPPD